MTAVRLPVLFQDELRNNCNCPRQFSSADFVGIFFGTVMLSAGVLAFRKKVPPWWVLVPMGLYSLRLHSVRFFTSPPLPTLARGN